MSSFVVLGVLARVDRRTRDAVEQRLTGRPGVSVFAVDDPSRMGILIETESLPVAEETLRDWVMTTPGVLGAWPVFLHDEPSAGESDPGPRRDVPREWRAS
jgi:hypothetical protein